MTILDSTHGLPVWLWTLLAFAAALVALALVNYAVARLAERRHPPAVPSSDLRPPSDPTVGPA
ncbi:hypothetical protein [Methylobacterium nigriterrae]|uniref:hypothetical protein n=1 Tax=Methylobacterium nigriterrae TaxID=3127512 RepID=UPI003013788C